MSVAAVAVPAKEAAPVVEAPRTLPLREFKLAEYEYARFSARLPQDATFEDALKPEFWVHVAHQLQKKAVTGEPDKAGAVIEVRTVDHAFYAELYVRAVHERGLTVGILREPVYFNKREVSSDKFDIRWNVGNRGYDIVRKSDKEIVASGLKTKDAAAEWITKTSAVN